MAEIKKGYYKVENTSIYVTEDQFMWEYSWFYHGIQDNVYLLAKEFKTNTTYTTPIDSKPGEDLTPKIQAALDGKTENIKQNMGSSPNSGDDKINDLFPSVNEGKGGHHFCSQIHAF